MRNYCTYLFQINISVLCLLLMIAILFSINCFSDELTVEEKKNLGLEKIRRFSRNGEGNVDKEVEELAPTIKQKAQKEKLIDVPREDTNSDTVKLQTDMKTRTSTERLKSNNAGCNEERKRINKNKSQVSIPKHYAIKISANKPWTRTNVYLKENDIVRIFCNGKVMPGGFEMVYNNTSCRAEGYHFTRDNFTVLPNARYMAAIGKIGNRDAFYIGSGREFVSYVNGTLRLGINDLSRSEYTGATINKRSIHWKDNTGYFEADIYVNRE